MKLTLTEGFFTGRYVAVRASVSIPRATRTAPKIARAGAEGTGTDVTRARADVKLLPGLIKPFQAAKSDVYRKLRVASVARIGDGRYLIRGDALGSFRRAVVEAGTALKKAQDKYKAEFDRAIEAEREALAGALDMSAYIHPDHIGEATGLTVEYSPLPDLNSPLIRDIMHQEKGVHDALTQLRSYMQKDALQSAAEDQVEALRAEVEDLRDKILRYREKEVEEGKDGRSKAFRNSTVTGVVDMADSVLQDPLSTEAKIVAERVVALDPALVRSDSGTALRTVEDALSVLDML